MGSRNHEVVPTPLITQLSGLRGGSGVHKSISALAKTNLIAKVKNAKCMAPARLFCRFDEGMVADLFLLLGYR